MASWSQEWGQVQRSTRRALQVSELLFTWAVVVVAQVCVKTHETSHLICIPPYPSLSSQVASLTISRQRGTVAERYRGEGTEKQNIRGQRLGKSFGGCYLYMELTRSRVKLTEFSKKKPCSQRKKKPGLKKPWVV